MAKRKQMNSIHTSIYGMDITISTNNIHIEDSYRVTNPVDMRTVLNDTVEFLNTNHITMDTPFNHRSICSMVREWIAHNNAYYMNYSPERTRSCDLNYPQPWYANILYFFCSLIII